jgi:hypothetical protein
MGLLAYLALPSEHSIPKHEVHPWPTSHQKKEIVAGTRVTVNRYWPALFHAVHIPGSHCRLSSFAIYDQQVKTLKSTETFQDLQMISLS